MEASTETAENSPFSWGLMRLPRGPTFTGAGFGRSGKPSCEERKSRALTLCIALLLASLAMPVGAAESKASRPNIVFIVADDLGYAELGCYGQDKIRTPNVDKLASQGMRFLRHYSGSPVCAPSRCVLMTGRHPGHAYIRSNKPAKNGQEPIPNGTVTLAELLQERGYACGAFGKWGLGYPGSKGDPLNQGFDRFFGYNDQRHAHSYYPGYLIDDDGRVDLKNNPPLNGHENMPEGADPTDPESYERFQGSDYGPDRIFEQALDFVRKHQDRPFFLYYPTIVPHLALHVPDSSLAKYKGEWPDPPYTGGHGYSPHYAPRAAYAAMVSRMDRKVGRLMELLKELGLSKETIVVFTSDNGPTFDRLGGSDSYFFESNGMLKGLKGEIYEGGVRVPMIVRWLGRVEPGTKSRRITGFEDWIPTLLELIGADGATPQNVDGISFAPTLQGSEQPKRPFLYREFYGYGGKQAVWQGKWKAVRRNIRRGNMEMELYNLEWDVAERNDISEEHPDIVDKMRGLLKREHEPSELFPMKAID